MAATTAAAATARVRSIALLWCAVPDDMQPATTKRSSSAVLKLGRYVVRCLTSQPDIWFLFLYKCGQLVAVNLHEPVAQSVGILDELFRTQDRSPPPSPRPAHRHQHHRHCHNQHHPDAIGSGQSRDRFYRPSSDDGRRTTSTSSSSCSAFSRSPPPPDNDQYRGMDDDDTDDGESAAVRDGYADTDTDTDDGDDRATAGRRFSRRSSSGCSRGYESYRSGGDSSSDGRHATEDADAASSSGIGSGTYVRDDFQTRRAVRP